MAKHRFLKPHQVRQLARLYSHRRSPELSREQRTASLMGMAWDTLLGMARAELRARDERQLELRGLLPPDLRTRDDGKGDRR